jgi:hypothetical protein
VQIEREKAKKRAMELGLEEIDRVKPKFRSDYGLIQGKGAVAKQQDAAAAAAAAAAEAGQPAAAAGESQQ